jgi:hypothetical protein
MLTRKALLPLSSLLLFMLLSGCASTLPVAEMPTYPMTPGDPLIHVTPLIYEGGFPNVIAAAGMDEVNLDTEARVFELFSKRYAAEFPELQYFYDDTLLQHIDLWYGTEIDNRERMLALLPSDSDRQDWLLVIDSLQIAPVRSGLLKWLGHVILLSGDNLPQFSVVLSARLVNLERDQPEHIIRLVSIDHPDRYSTVFDDRLAYTVKEAAGELITYLRDWRSR